MAYSQQVHHLSLLFVSVDCPAGYKINGNVCEACPQGTYQEQPYQTQCNSCTPGQSTRHNTSTSASDCESEQTHTLALFGFLVHDTGFHASLTRHSSRPSFLGLRLCFLKVDLILTNGSVMCGDNKKTLRMAGRIYSRSHAENTESQPISHLGTICFYPYQRRLASVTSL